MDTVSYQALTALRGSAGMLPMPSFVHEILHVIASRPLTSLLALIAAVLYVRLMTSDPRPH